MAIASAAVLAIGALMAAGKPEASFFPKQGEGWRMPYHSFAKTLTYDDRLGDWLSSASSMALRNRMQLLPPVPDRYGIFWNKKAVSTHNFEATFSLSGVADPKVKNQDGVAVFWISMTNFSASFNEQAIISTSKDWGVSLKANDLTLVGNSPKFHGLAVIFASHDKKKSPRQTISGVWGDGQKVQALPDIIGDSPAFLNWITPAPKARVRVRAQADGSIIGSVLNMDQWIQIFQLPPSTLPREGDMFIGFSGYSGSSSSVEVNIEDLEMINFDKQKMGEDASDMLSSGSLDSAEWVKVLNEEKRFVSQASQKDAILRLTKLLGAHVDRYDKLGEKLKEDIVKMESRLDLLGTDVGSFLAAAQAWDVNTQTMDPKIVKDHILGIKAVLTKGQEGLDAKLLHVNQAAKDLKEKHGSSTLNEMGKSKVLAVHEQSKVVQEYAHRGSVQTNGMLLVLVLAVVGLGLLFLSRMRYYEKKHYF